MALLDEFGTPLKGPQVKPNDPMAGCYKFREDEMPPVKSGEFVLSEDYYRGYRAIGSFLPDGRIHVKEVQATPDAFFKAIKIRRERWEGRSRRPNTQRHLVPIGEIPDALKRQILTTDPGHMLHPADPEAQKRMKKFWNDIDYKNLRIGGGYI